MAIVIAEAKYLAELWRLYNACMRAMHASGIEQWGEDYPTADIIEGDIRAGSLYVLHEGGAMVAAICLNEEQHESYRTLRWETTEPVLVVHRLCVDPARQRGGIGNRLMDFAEEQARLNRYSGIRLDTYSGNPAALRLYERRGYRKIGEVRFRGRPLPFCCFEKVLREAPHRAPA